MRTIVLAICSTLALVTGASPPIMQSTKLLDDLYLRELTPLWNTPCQFRADAYIAVAGKLRAAGKEKAAGILRRAARDHNDNLSVFILCRMLFEAKPKGDFRGPILGQPCCRGGSRYLDWPLAPIELVDGVPFEVVVYSLGGFPEPGEMYLNYCLEECVWGVTEFKAKTPEEKKKALDKLLSSPKWKTPLTDGEKRILAAQIE